MISQTRGNGVRHNLTGKLLLWTRETSFLCLEIPAQSLNIKVILFGSMDLGFIWVSHDPVSIKIHVWWLKIILKTLHQVILEWMEKICDHFTITIPNI
jgi:hypothetical protein